MTDKTYVIRGYHFGYNDETFYVEGYSINSVYHNKEEAEQAYRKLEINMARNMPLSDVESIFNNGKEFAAHLARFLYEKTDVQVLDEDGYMKYGDNLPANMQDDDVMTFIEMADMHAYKLLEFDGAPKFHAIWLPHENSYMSRPSEGVETLVYAVSREALKAELDEWGEYNGWESWKGKLEDISHSPLLLERLIKGDKNLRYDAGRRRLTVKEGTSGKTWLALNELLIKPLFEVRELSVDEVMETEKQLLAEAGY